MGIETLFLLAVVLLIMEVFVPSFGFLGFGGFVAFVTGIIILISAGETHFYGVSVDNIIMAGIFIFLIFAAFGYLALRAFKKKIETGVESMIDQKASVKKWSKGKGIITFEGEDWRASGDGDIKSGEDITITGYQSMTLTVTKTDNS